MLTSLPRAKWGKRTWSSIPTHSSVNILDALLTGVSIHRARLVNYIKTSEVIRQPYPLQMRSAGPHNYFLKRETWGWTDFLMNPMVKKDVGALSLIDVEFRKHSVSVCASGCLVLINVFVSPAGYDDGSAPADHCPAAQGCQHQRPRDEKGKRATPSLNDYICLSCCANLLWLNLRSGSYCKHCQQLCLSTWISCATFTEYTNYMQKHSASVEVPKIVIWNGK